MRAKRALIVLALACAGAASGTALATRTCSDARASGSRLYSVRGISFAGVKRLGPQAVPVPLLRKAARLEGLRGRIFYRAALIDLGGDARRELVFRPEGAFLCGTSGCSTFVFRIDRGRVTKVGDIPITRTPLVVSSHRTRGWRDLIPSTSGGGFPADWGLVRWHGRYDANPTVSKLQSRARISGVAILRNPRACTLQQEQSFRA